MDIRVVRVQLLFKQHIINRHTVPIVSLHDTPLKNFHLFIILPNAERFARSVFRQKCLCIFLYLFLFFCYNFFKFQLALQITVLAQSFSNLTCILVRAIAFDAQNFEGQGQSHQKVKHQNQRNPQLLSKFYRIISKLGGYIVYRQALS